MTANGRVVFQRAQALGTVLRKEVAWGRILKNWTGRGRLGLLGHEVCLGASKNQKTQQLQGCSQWHFGDFVVTRQGSVWIGSRDLNGWHFHSHVNGTADLMGNRTRGGRVQTLGGLLACCGP